MANTIRVTAARLYSELRGRSNIRTTAISAYAELKGVQSIRISRASSYVELSGSDTKVRTSAINAYVEVDPNPDQVRVSSIRAYVELTPGVTSHPTPPTEPTSESYNYVRTTDLIILAGAQLTGILLPQFLVYAEMLDAQIKVSKFGVLPEISSSEVHVTKFGVLVEIIYQPPQPTGVLIVGTHKTWKDAYPKNVTDIPLLQAYNFIISTNGMYMIDIEWDNVLNEDGYEIERSSNGTTGWTLVHTTDPNVTKYTSVLLEPNTTYYYRVRSFNEGGYSAYSSVISETTKRAGPYLLGQTSAANISQPIIYIDKPRDVNNGDFMIMQIGIQDPSKINAPEHWTLEDTISGEYTNLIYSKVASHEPDYYAITRTDSDTPIVTVSIFAWDGANDQIIYFDG